MRIVSIIIALMLISGCARKPQYREAPVSKDEIVIDISTLTGEIPVFFSYNEGGKRYDFFVQTVDDEVRAYVDACFKCAPKRKGFETDGRKLRCRACGESFPVENLSGVGSCYPIPLAGEVKDGRYIITIKQLISKCKHPL